MNIFFDLDGTLIDTSLRNYTVYKNLVTKLTGKPLNKNIYWRLKRNKTKLSKILKLSQLPENSFALFEKNFIKKIESPRYLKLDTLFPFTMLALNQLLKSEHHLYLISYRQYRERALDEISTLGLNKIFNNIKIGRILNSGYKTKSEFINQINNKNKKINHLNTRGIIVGDTEDEVLTARSRKLTSVIVLSGIRNKNAFKKNRPDFILKNISLLPSLLETISIPIDI